MSTRRPIPFLLFYLTLGVLTTIAISWFLALCPHAPGPARYITSLLPHDASPDHWDYARLDSIRGRGLEIYLLRATRWGNDARPRRIPFSVDATTDASKLVRPWALPLACPWLCNRPWPQGVRSLHAIVANGWPCVAMWNGYASTLQTPGDFEPHEHALPIPHRTFTVGQSTITLPTALPTGIIWRGFALDTALYSALWALTFTIPHFIRRALRHRRGLCPRCTYNLAGLPPHTACPECGHVPRVSRSSAIPVSPNHP